MSAGIIAIAVLLFWVLTLHQQRTEANKVLNYFRHQVILEADLAHQVAALEGGWPLALASENLDRVVMSTGDEVYGEAHFWAKQWALNRPESKLLRELQGAIRRSDFTLEYYASAAFDWNRTLSRPGNRGLALVLGWGEMPCLACLSLEEVNQVQSQLIPSA